MPFLDALWVELELFSSDGIYKGVYHLVEGLEEEGDVDDECSPETFGVMILENVQDLGKGVLYRNPFAESTEKGIGTLREVEKGGLLPFSP